MMSGHTIQKLLHGVNLTALAIYPPLVKAIQLRWWMMSCTYLVGALKKAPTWATWQHSGLLRGAGTLSKIWVRRRRRDLATA